MWMQKLVFQIHDMTLTSRELEEKWDHIAYSLFASLERNGQTVSKDLLSYKTENSFL